MGFEIGKPPPSIGIAGAAARKNRPGSPPAGIIESGWIAYFAKTFLIMSRVFLSVA